jgi:SPX domain protein involved in polyphosphate accumulation
VEEEFKKLEKTHFSKILEKAKKTTPEYKLKTFDEFIAG